MLKVKSDIYGLCVAVSMTSPLATAASLMNTTGAKPPEILPGQKNMWILHTL